MTRLLSLVGITVTVSVGLLFAACSGSSGVTFPDASTTTDSGNTSGGLGGDSGPGDDSGIVCAPCETENPNPALCTTTDPCKCGPFTCVDGGSTDACTWNATTNPCGAGKYCLAVACGKGTCVAVGTNETAANNPRCGCDGVTYWNATVAASHGMSVSKTGVCNGGSAVTCGGPANTACPAGASCNLEKGKLEDCADGKAGQCWGLPTTCPGAAAVGKDAKSCGGGVACIGDCAAIKTGTPWYSDTCPIFPPVP